MTPNPAAATSTLSIIRAKFAARVSDTETLVLMACAELPEGVTYSEIMRRTGLQNSTTATVLARLKRRGELDCSGPNNGNRFVGESKFWIMTDKGKSLVNRLTTHL